MRRWSGLAGTWARNLCGMLNEGRLGDVLDDLRRRTGDVEACRKAVAYLDDKYWDDRAARLSVWRFSYEQPLTYNLSHTLSQYP